MAVHSMVKIKCSDNQTATITFKDLLAQDESELKRQVHLLGNWMQELTTYRNAIGKQEEELIGLWDEFHTRGIRRSMDDCAENIDEALKSYQQIYDNLVLLVGARLSLISWLGSHPEYNNRHLRVGGVDFYYCKKATVGGGGFPKQTTLNYPS